VWGKNISVLASCESLSQAKKALNKGYAASIIVSNHISDKAYIKENIKIIPCPQQTREVTCERCKLCMKDQMLKSQNAVIAFAAHGARKKVALTVIK